MLILKEFEKKPFCGEANILRSEKKPIKKTIQIKEIKIKSFK